MTFIALDDEPLALKIIEKHAQSLPDWQMVASFTDAGKAIDFVKTNAVDLVISDINMPDINGLQFVKELKDEKPLIIFITAYKEHALDGYELDVIDYLMKPVSQERFIKAMNKATSQIHLKSSAQTKSNIQERDKYFFVYSEYEQIKIIIDDILYIEGMGDYVKIYLTSQLKPVITLERIKKLTDILSDRGFVRIHRSYVVNLTKIEAKQKSKIKLNNTWLAVGETYQSLISEII